MLPNPEMTLQLVRDHQCDLLHEAELERLAAQAHAHADKSRLAAGALHPFAAALAAVTCTARFRQAPAGHRRRAPQVLAPTER